MFALHLWKTSGMSNYLQNKKFISRNLLVWGSLYLLIMLSQFAGEENVSLTDVASVSGAFIAMMVIFYLHFFACEKFFYLNKWLYFLSLLLLFVSFLLILYLSDAKPELPALKMEHKGKRFLLYLYMSLYFFILVLLSGFYWSVLYSARKSKETAAIQLRLQQMENQKIYAEKKFLQSQINPHFLYNTLNFFYAKSLSVSPELSDGIMTLSEIMKYSLQKNENETGLVYLEDEITHLQNVIHIHQLRFNNRLQIRFSFSGKTENVMILPLTLITLVENALKHGELHDPESPVQINLLCDEEKQKLIFSVYNKKRSGPKEPSTGIGLENTLKRLNWMYSQNFRLDTTDEGQFFKAELSVPLFWKYETTGKS